MEENLGIQVGEKGVNWEDPEAVSEAIKAIGSLPNVTLHFSLSNWVGDPRLDTPENIQRTKSFSVTTNEFLTIMGDPALRSKTTFYETNFLTWYYTINQPIEAQE